MISEVTLSNLSFYISFKLCSILYTSSHSNHKMREVPVVSIFTMLVGIRISHGCPTKIPPSTYSASGSSASESLALKHDAGGTLHFLDHIILTFDDDLLIFI